MTTYPTATTVTSVVTHCHLSWTPSEPSCWTPFHRRCCLQQLKGQGRLLQLRSVPFLTRGELGALHIANTICMGSLSYLNPHGWWPHLRGGLKFKLRPVCALNPEAVQSPLDLEPPPSYKATVSIHLTTCLTTLKTFPRKRSLLTFAPCRLEWPPPTVA